MENRAKKIAQRRTKTTKTDAVDALIAKGVVTKSQIDNWFLKSLREHLIKTGELAA